MPQANFEFSTLFTPKVGRWIRQTFERVGVDNYTAPPAQNPDMFEQLTNIMPITTGALQRRWGYQLWNSSNPIVAQHASEYQNQTTGLRQIVLLAADGTGSVSATNAVNSYSEAGVFNTTIFTPAAGASKPYMVNSRNYAYFTDGVIGDQKKWDGSTVTKWGIAAPTVAPSINVQSGASTPWQANTEFWTMGIFVDTNGNAQQLISVNAQNNNTTQFGSSGGGQPAWNQTKTGTTPDGTITWTNVGQITLWSAGLSVTYRQPIYDPATGGLYVNYTNGTLTTGNVKPSFSGVDGSFTNETTATGASGTIQWGCIGNISNQTLALPVVGVVQGKNQDNNVWKPSTVYQQFDHLLAGVVEPQALPSTIGSPLPSTPIYLQLNLGAAGTSGTGSGNPPAQLATVAGNLTTDNQLTWLCLGSATWPANSSVKAILGNQLGQNFNVVQSGGFLYVCTTAIGNTGNLTPNFAGTTTFGGTVADGSNVVWTCVGATPSWAANTQFFLPTNGWVVPTAAQKYGGTEIVATVGGSPFEQFVTTSGKSGGSAPTFSNVTNTTTADGTVTWTCGGPFVAVTGSISLTSGASYFVVFHNANTGNYSDLSPVSVFTGALSSDAVLLSGIPVSSDPQVTDVTILRTADGGNQTTLYFVNSVPNGTTVYSDTMTEPVLLDQNIFQETDQFGNLIGVANNQPPILQTLPIPHRGRLYAISGETLLFSKALSDLTTSTGKICGRWEEDWPPNYQLDISGIAEVPRALQSDGSVLYIGTERHIHRLLGDGPTNYGQPERIFTETGVLNQETWISVFVQDQPVGMMWLTPDFRVIGSDYNTYEDAGRPIQTTLNSINSAAASTSWAMFVSNGQFDLFMLAIPTGAATLPNTLCVFDMRTQQWVVWNPTDTVTAGVFNINASGTPQWIFSASTGVTYKFAPNQFQDRINNTPVSFAATIRTSWFSPFDLSMRKLLNEIQLMTGDAAIAVTLEGANTDADFATPVALVSGATPVVNAFGDYVVGLLGAPSRFRYYRLTVSATDTVQDLLRGYSFEVIPFTRI